MKMGCSKCEYSPKTYEAGQRKPSAYCPDAYTEKSYMCGNYGKEEKKEVCKADRKE